VPRLRLPWFLALAACGSDDKLLAELDGAYSGTFSTEGVELALTADFDWRKGEELLFGEVGLTLPAEEPSVWAVRRWQVVGDEVFLELTDTAEASRGMNLEGIPGETFSGEAGVSFACPEGTCGFYGPFSLSRSAAPPPATSGT
jgi:hypothetical protein